MPDVKELYKQKLISIPEAVWMVQSNQSICTAMAASEPPGLMSALGSIKDRVENVTVITTLAMRPYDFFSKPEMKGHFRMETWFMGDAARAAHQYGTVSYIPNNLHEAGPRRAMHLPPDIFWGTASPMDKHGYFSLSLGVTYEKVMVEKAETVVLEINENLPRTYGDTMVHISEVDYIVENTTPLPELPPIQPSHEEKLIGQHIAELIEDGSTIQLGIGGIPNAIAQFLLDKKDLGVHTELLTDGMVDLWEAGVITNRKKTLWPGKMVGCFALGTKKLYDFLDNNLAVELQQGPVTNNPYIIARNAKMISINTSLQVDLTGQVCSESMGHIQYSGAGGQADTHRGAQMSPGGKAFIALRSTAKKGTISTIVPQLAPGANVTLTRNDVDYVVTEFGVAHLKGRCVADRAESLIGIAHPDFREELRKEARRLGLI